MRWFRRDRSAEDAPPILPKAGRPPAMRPDESIVPALAEVATPHIAAVRTRLLEAAGIGTDSPILEVGCGASPAIGPGWIGIDRSEGLARRGARGSVVCADPLDLPVGDGTARAVISNLRIARATDLVTSLHELVRVLAPGGTLALSVWAGERDELSGVWERLTTETLGVELARQIRAESEPAAGVVHRPDRFEDALRDAGLRPVRVERAAVKLTLSLQDYVTWKTVEPYGRGVAAALGTRLWDSFVERVRSTYAETFPSTVGDFRDLLFAIGEKPR